MEEMHRFGVFFNRDKKGCDEALNTLREAVRACKAELVFAHEVGAEDALRDVRVTDLPDAVISLGGDGTVLFSARQVGTLRLPLMGVNLGRLGFLAEIGPGAIAEAVHSLSTGQYRIQERGAIRVQGREGRRLLWSHEGLNEALVSGTETGRVTEIRITIGGEFLTTYRADGVIVATPTGSTAHSLSAGGPVVEPTMEALIVNAVCPHTLAVRPLVISDQRKLTLKAGQPGGRLSVTIDGQRNEWIDAGARLEVRRAPYRMRVLQVTSRGFYSVLRGRLGWRGSAAPGSP